MSRDKVLRMCVHLFVSSVLISVTSGAELPNIVFIIADDLVSTYMYSYFQEFRWIIDYTTRGIDPFV